MVSKKYFKGFTLAEIMIVLTVIGILSAVLIPSAINSTPDENILKFKKAHSNLYRVINTLVTSDKYYCKGDLGIKADCSQKVTSSDGLMEYFCNTVADLLSVKSVNCITTAYGGGGKLGYKLLSNEDLRDFANGSRLKRTVTPETIQATKEYFDEACKTSSIAMGKEIITTDGVAYYNVCTTVQFGSGSVSPNENNHLSEPINLRYFSPPNQIPANYGDQDGFDISYKIYCMDVDGVPTNATKEDCKNECPFGYGIRADGKIMNGIRAEEWLEKSITKGS